MAEGDTRLRLEMEPVDSLFFRDARPFEPASHGASGLPMPQTLAGAVRTLLLERHGVDFGRLGIRTRNGASFAEALTEFGPEAEAVASVRVGGPWFTLNGEVLVPTPASIQREKKELEGQRTDAGKDTRPVVRRDPLKDPLPGWKPEVPGMLPLWRYGRKPVEAVDGFLRPGGLLRFLEGGTPGPCDLVPRSDVYGFEGRTGIGVDPNSNSAAEGAIYGVRMLVLKSKAGLCAEVSGPAAALEPLAAATVLMKFGGEGRHVIVRAEQGCVDWPVVPPGSGKGRLVLLTTPAWFNGWKPRRIEPVAAAVGGHQAVSGWNLAAGGPKPNRFMVPAGSVYFLRADAHVPDELVDDEDACVGWGCFLGGNWSHA